tara:strand:+ start:3343 stop:3588 length:246 start_codon:yes stop_codon:yes gene_type:complete
MVYSSTLKDKLLNLNIDYSKCVTTVRTALEDKLDHLAIPDQSIRGEYENYLFAEDTYSQFMEEYTRFLDLEESYRDQFNIN